MIKFPVHYFVTNTFLMPFTLIRQYINLLFWKPIVFWNSFNILPNLCQDIIFSIRLKRRLIHHSVIGLQFLVLDFFLFRFIIHVWVIILSTLIFIFLFILIVIIFFIHIIVIWWIFFFYFILRFNFHFFRGVLIDYNFYDYKIYINWILAKFKK